MRVVVCEAPLRMNMVDRPIPSPGVGEALVRIRRIGVCGTDLHAFRGEQPFLDYPRVLGHELSGVVAALPEPHEDLAVGEPVVILPYLECGDCVACRAGKPNCCVEMEVLGVHRDGGMQEQIAVPTTHLLPARGLDADQAAMVECLSIGAHANRRAAVTQSDSVLVIGAGPIGLGVLQFAHAVGARVSAIDRDGDRLALVRTLLPAVETLSPQDRGRIADLTGGVDVVFDATGNRDSMAGAVEYLAHGGRMVFVGLVQGEFAIHHPSFHKREATLLSSRNATRQDFESVMEAMRSGSIDVPGMISQHVDLDQVVDGFPEWSQRPPGLVKTMIRVPGP